MDEGDAEALATQAQSVARVGRSVVEVEGAGRPVAPDCVGEEVEHVALALGRVGLKCDGEARGVVDNRVHPNWDDPAIDAQVRAVTDIGLPEGAGIGGFPVEAGVAVALGRAGDAVKSLLLK